MQRTIVIALLLAATGACQQVKKNSASLTGEIKGLQDTAIYLSVAVEDSFKTDTIPVKDGRFGWNGHLAEPQQVYLRTSTRPVELFMENAGIRVEGNADSLDMLRVTGSAVHDEYKAYQASIGDVTAAMEGLFGKFEAAKDNDSAKAVLEEELERLRGKLHPLASRQRR